MSTAVKPQANQSPPQADATAKPTAVKPVVTPASTQPMVRKLKKGELLFAEGESSRAMYLIKSGILRVFKKRGEANIEIDTIRSGSIIGELAFLDGNPRSASAEALIDTEIVEIGGPVFQTTLNSAPEWLKILLKTVVGRLRNASTKIRQLESVSTAVDYSDKNKKSGSSHYVFLSTNDVLKVCLAIFTIAKEQASDNPAEIQINGEKLYQYTYNIMQVATSKLTAILDLLSQTGVLLNLQPDTFTASLCDLPFLEQFIKYVVDENQTEPSKRHDITPKGFLIMSFMAKHLSRFEVNPETGKVVVNMAIIRKDESTTLGGKEAFKFDDFAELVKLGYATQINAKSSDEMTTEVIAETFIKAFKFQRVLMSMQAMNDQKKPMK